ncbi:hypothetical protein FRACYDRAFT_258093 [Fragilariopsis cylindrus CCMP1102]|uniref:Oligoxyloglucan reducing end-specific cellobiohydrolase n=1 Tax=Fragilariopsis cylindrus CCMP1102 TaxID=635003 RepID=A0A1E7EIU6_9STRA|nr:hypothetical protein FRACYDRAFT_258093 [Fragilariopsis cylindrus CCMP1102]|eukprot:OEU05811.1 hypothetical protein FRACYDRAFT_258093 [Fragilariopsis cylindrus CCMP1102]
MYQRQSRLLQSVPTLSPTFQVRGECENSELWRFDGDVIKTCKTYVAVKPKQRCKKIQPVYEAKFLSGQTVPVTNGQTSNMFPQGGDRNGPKNVVCGAIQTVLAHPLDPDICFAGACNGGVFRTEDCTTPEPRWQPLSDQEDSLSVGDMAFDDGSDGITNPNTIVVAIGTRSSFGRAGGPAVGLMLTDNALDPMPVWTSLDNAGGDVNFRTKAVKFNSVYIRGDLILASAYQSTPFRCPYIGIFRSTDRGKTWTNALVGQGRAIASDPNNDGRFYATLDFTGVCSNGFLPLNGVYTSDDNGETWTITAPVPSTSPLNEGELNNAKLSVSKDGSRVWSALLKNGQANSISFSDTFGTSWSKMDPVQTKAGDDGGLNPREKPGGSGSIHFSLLASSKNKDIVYVGGDRQGLPFPNEIGAIDFNGRLFRGNSTVPPLDDDVIFSPQWEHMTHSNSISQSPGGGTASLSAPHADSRDMKIRADGVILEGDDGGVAIRSSPDDNKGDWFGICGNMQAFETHSIAYEPIFGSVLFGSQDTGTMYGTLGNKGTFTSLLVGDGGIALIDSSSSTESIFLYFSFQYGNGLTRTDIRKDTGMITAKSSLDGPVDAAFVPVTAMDPNNQDQFVVADGSDFVIRLFQNRGLLVQTLQTPLSGISAIAWNEFIYIAQIKKLPTAASEGRIRSLAINPLNTNNVVAVFTPAASDLLSPEVFESKDGGTTWKDIGGTPSSLLAKSSTGGAAVFIISKDLSSSFLAVGTSNGVLIKRNTDDWELFATGLPKVAVLDMVYESLDDTLVIATLGRGVWFLRKAIDIASGAGIGLWSQENNDDTRATVDMDSLLVGPNLTPVTPNLTPVTPVPPDDAPYEGFDEILR